MTVKVISWISDYGKLAYLLLSFCVVFNTQAAPAPNWSKTERALLKLQWIKSLPPLPADPSNRYADDPAAARLGQKLFFDKHFSGNGKVACASCHIPENTFTDGLARSQGMGEKIGRAHV